MLTLAGQMAFSYLAGASVASALLAVTRRSPIHSMLWVLALFLHVAGLFLLVGAEFLAAVQVIVYAGAILVFYLFFLMLIDLPAETAGPPFGAHWPLAAAAGVAFAALAWYAQIGATGAWDAGGAGGATGAGGAGGAWGATGAGAPNSLSSVGMALFTRFALPFEIASLILLAAIVGAVVVARKTES